jgi:hypothetical protein
MTDLYIGLSMYELRHLPVHLLQAAQINDLYGLARDEDFLAAQTDVLEGEPDAALQTLQAALRGACNLDDAAGVADFLLKYADRMRATQNEPPLCGVDFYQSSVRRIGLVPQRKKRSRRMSRP